MNLAVQYRQEAQVRARVTRLLLPEEEVGLLGALLSGNFWPRFYDLDAVVGKACVSLRSLAEDALLNIEIDIFSLAQDIEMYLLDVLEAVQSLVV